MGLRTNLNGPRLAIFMPFGSTDCQGPYMNLWKVFLLNLGLILLFEMCLYGIVR